MNPSSEREIEQAERIAVLELEVKLLRDSLKTIGEKLDELLILRSKGMGAFWLASALVGTGVVGAIAAFIDYIRN